MLRKEAGLTDIVNSMAIENSERSYKQLFELLFSSLCGFSFCILKSSELAEEVASDTMFILWNRRTDLILVENIRAYAFIIARNLSLNILKKELKKNNTVSMDEISVDIFLNHDTPEQLFISAELKRSLEETINLLPPRSKMVFKLIKEDGFSYKEVAEILEISVKTVDAHLVAALKKMSLILNKEFRLT
jgi:RNA polymerase sigma-70 factor (family 1)